MKIQCDRRVPCHACKRRGLTHLCPSESRKTGEGTRTVLAVTEPLQRRITRLHSRITQLEQELHVLYSQHSSEVHPLLHDCLGDQDNRNQISLLSGNKHSRRQPATIIEAFGTLSISDHGISRFYGPTGSPEVLLCAKPDSCEALGMTEANFSEPYVDSNLNSQTLFSRSFPFVSISPPSDVQENLKSHLPSYDYARAICETYYDQVSWLTCVLTRSQLMHEMLPAIYRRCGNTSSPFSLRNMLSPHGSYAGPHDLALVFIVLAIGSLVQYHPFTDIAEHFQQLAYAAIKMQSVLDNPSLATIQTLHLMSLYNGLAGNDSKNDNCIELTWALRMMAAHLAQSIGLHREGTKWGFSEKELERRQIVFWHLFTIHSWESLFYGRPLGFSLVYIDCGFPQVTDDTKHHTALWRFTADVVNEVISQTFTSDMPSYETIMRLDKIVRDYTVNNDASNGKTEKEVKMMQFMQRSLKESRGSLYSISQNTSVSFILSLNVPSPWLFCTSHD